MSRPEKEASARQRSAHWGAGEGLAGGWLAGLLAVLACLPSEDISGYSSGLRSNSPGVAQEEAAPEPLPAPSAVVAPVVEPEAPAPAPPVVSTGPLATGECNGDCFAPELPLRIDAGSAAPAEDPGGSVAPADAADVSDAGPAPVPVDAAPVGPCGQGALAVEDRCFALVTTPSSWSDARELCTARGSGWELAVIRSAERNSLLAGMLGGVTDAWVGANDLAQEGSWRWVGDTTPFFTGTGADGSAAAGAYVNWNTGGTPEPNGGAASDCLRLRANGGWADIACTSTFAALCEGPLGLQP